MYFLFLNFIASRKIQGQYSLNKHGKFKLEYTQSTPIPATSNKVPRVTPIFFCYNKHTYYHLQINETYYTRFLLTTFYASQSTIAYSRGTNNEDFIVY